MISFSASITLQSAFKVRSEIMELFSGCFTHHVVFTIILTHNNWALMIHRVVKHSAAHMIEDAVTCKSMRKVTVTHSNENGWSAILDMSYNIYDLLDMSKNDWFTWSICVVWGASFILFVQVVFSTFQHSSSFSSVWHHVLWYITGEYTIWMTITHILSKDTNRHIRTVSWHILLHHLQSFNRCKLVIQQLTSWINALNRHNPFIEQISICTSELWRVNLFGMRTVTIVT